MIANNEINENGIIFSRPPLVGPTGFLKNQFTPPPPPPPYHFFGNFIVPFDMKDLICKDVYLYAVWIY